MKKSEQDILGLYSLEAGLLIQPLLVYHLMKD